MSNEVFIRFTIKWIRAKLVLANHSHWYKIPYRKTAILKVQQNFALFLYQKGKYSAGQLAILVKRHENLLETILPIPQNPCYQNSYNILKDLITQAETIINQHNLTV